MVASVNKRHTASSVLVNDRAGFGFALMDIVPPDILSSLASRHGLLMAICGKRYPKPPGLPCQASGKRCPINKHHRFAGKKPIDTTYRQKTGKCQAVSRSGGGDARGDGLEQFVYRALGGGMLIDDGGGFFNQMTQDRGAGFAGFGKGIGIACFGLQAHEFQRF